jgi:hypothetical protein
MRWHLSHRCDDRGRPLADRHYSRKSIGAKNFAPPGRCLVLLTENADALWITSWPFDQYVKHDWAGAWLCSCFRNESQHLSSELIREAVAVTRWYWPEIPDLGMVTFVNIEKTRKRRGKRNPPGQCYIKAGFERVGETRGGLPALILPPDRMPDEHPPLPEILIRW